MNAPVLDVEPVEMEPLSDEAASQVLRHFSGNNTQHCGYVVKNVEAGCKYMGERVSLPLALTTVAHQPQGLYDDGETFAYYGEQVGLRTVWDPDGRRWWWATSDASLPPGWSPVTTQGFGQMAWTEDARLEAAVSHLARGATIEAAAAAASTDVARLLQKVAQPAFARRLARARATHRQAAAARWDDLAVTVVECLAQIMADEKASNADRLRAARVYVDAREMIARSLQKGAKAASEASGELVDDGWSKMLGLPASPDAPPLGSASNGKSPGTVRP